MMAPIVASIMEMVDQIDPVPWVDESVVEWALGF